MSLLSNSVFLLLLIAILGVLLGKVKIFSFSFDSSAVIFVAIFFGYYGYLLPKDFQTLGLVLFIYSIGVQAGPGFLSSFRSNGAMLSAGAAVIVVSGFLTAVCCALYFGFSEGICAGLFAGSLTSTPGLAVAVEMVTGGQAAAAYGLTYTFGVIGVILYMKILPRLCSVNIASEEEKIAGDLKKEHPPVSFCHIEVTNPNLLGKTVRDLFLDKIAPVTITRLLRKGATEPVLVDGGTRIEAGDHLRVVGLDEDLQKMRLYIGRKIQGEIAFNSALIKRKILVSRKEIVGKTLGSLNLRDAFNVQVSRVSRNGMDIPPSSQMRINMGDIIHVVGQDRSVDNIRKHLGNDVTALHSASVISIFLGIFAGFLLGKVPLFVPGVGMMALGTTGGVLVAGLVFSGLKKTGPVVWFVPSTTNAFIRDLGLFLFLAVIGTRAGSTIGGTLSEFGLPLLASGVLVTLIPLLTSTWVCASILKIPFLRMLGILTGGMTSTPGLAATTSISDTPYASTAYATVYPVALIGMIIFTKLIVWIL